MLQNLQVTVLLSLCSKDMFSLLKTLNSDSHNDTLYYFTALAFENRTSGENVNRSFELLKPDLSDLTRLFTLESNTADRFTKPPIIFCQKVIFSI